MKSRLPLVCTLLGLLALPATAEIRTLTGSVTYLDRSALPPNAVLEVQLLDVSLADVAATQHALLRTKIDNVPVRFSLQYDDRLIVEGLSYSVTARIVDGRQTLYRSTSVIPVLTRGAGDTDLKIVVDRMKTPDTVKPEPALQGTAWMAQEVSGMKITMDNGPSILFSEDGSVSGSAGCNRFTGAAEISGAEIVFGPMAATRMACVDPDRAAVEAAYFSVLSGTVTQEIQDGTLSLFAADGTVLARFRPE